jgi:hypothetical protein
MITLDILAKAGWQLVDKYEDNRLYFVHPSTGRVKEYIAHRSDKSRARAIETAVWNMGVDLAREESARVR